ncbi:S8 family serine peptidase [Pseudoalteromonas shioyasakiensis]|uniref:S8 family serine peptidase n=1 Tax=Pseudoalteromonas shioyasakiensis TaxID=1190813 RepID=UPI0021175A21|nr:S8 family serine peptidase [Pseudoalteromonas shioyasakiensis]
MGIKVGLFFIISLFINFYSYASSPDYYLNQWYLYGGALNDTEVGGIGYDKYLLEGIDESNEVVTVILSSGIDVNHEDLSGSMWVNENEIPSNGIDDDNNGYIDDIHGINPSLLNGDLIDEYGFGTAMAGVIAGTKNNIGINGLSSNNKIIGCKVSPDVYTRDYIKCIDYIIGLKNQLNLNIASVVYDWTSTGLKIGQLDHNVLYATQLTHNAIKKLEANDILVIAPARYGFDYPIDGDTDFTFSLPQSLLMSNTILVSGIYLNDYLNMSGGNSISTFAASDYIFSTSYKKRYEPLNADFTFEPKDVPLENLHKVEVMTEHFTTGNDSWGFIDNQATLILPSLDFSRTEEKEFVISFDLLNNSKKSIHLEVMKKDGSWLPVSNTFHRSVEWYEYSRLFSLEYSDVDFSDVKFKLVTHVSDSDDNNLYVDNIKITKKSQTVEKDDYRISSGNFMAVAQVAGAAALLKSAKNLSMPSIRNLIISSGVDLQNAEHSSLNNKRLSIIGNHQGLLDCKNQQVTKRLYPQTEQFITRVKGKELIIKGININCSVSLGDMTIKDLTKNKEYIAKDDGLGLDKYENDGYNIASITFDDVGMHELSVGSDKTIAVYSVNPYKIHTELGDFWLDKEDINAYTFDDFPFKIKIGGLKEGINASVRTIQNRWADLNNALSIFSSFTSENNIKPTVLYEGKVKEHANISGEKNKTEPQFSVNRTHNILDEESTPQEYDYKYVYNGISNPWEEEVTLIPSEFDLQKLELTTLPISNQRLVTGEDKNRVVIFTSHYDQYDQLEDTHGEVQTLIFEQGSTIVYSYRNLSENLKSAITTVGMEIGSNYKISMPFDDKTNSSYVLKDDDGVNTAPVQNENTILINQEQNIYNIGELFSDADNDVLLYRLANQESYFRLNVLGQLTVDYQKSWVVGETIKVDVLVTDGEVSLTKTLNLLITEELNNKPSFNLEKVTLNTSEEIILNLNEYMKNNNGEDVNISIPEESKFFSIQSNILTGKIMKSEFYSAPSNLKLLLSYGGELVEHVVSIELHYVNHSPEIIKEPSTIQLNKVEEVEIHLLDFFYDMDEELLSFQISTDLNYSIMDNHFMSLSAGSLAEGEYSLKIVATDSESNSSELEFKVLIKNNVEPSEQLMSESSSGGVIEYFYLIMFFSLYLVRIKTKGAKGITH